MKKLLLLFVVMLGTLGAYAQSNTTPIKGDVNEDGVVDVADINAVIEIMKNGGGISGDTKYYWYSGTTIPTAENIASIATGYSNEKPNWTESDPHSVKATNNTGESAYLYYCFPAEWNIKILDSDKTSEVLLNNEEGNLDFTYNGIKYHVQRSGSKFINGTTKDYWAVIPVIYHYLYKSTYHAYVEGLTIYPNMINMTATEPLIGELKIDQCTADDGQIALFVYPESWGTPTIMLTGDETNWKTSRDKPIFTVPSGYTYRWAPANEHNDVTCEITKWNN